MTRTVYKAFGLTIASDFELPELQRLENNIHVTDIIVIQANLTKLWEELKEPNERFIIKENFVLFQVPHVATYLIRNGDEIFISPMEGVDESLLRLYLLGSCMGAILLQRRVLPLHGSAIAINGKAYAIVGDSGAGKSTLASAFMQCGFKLLTDDIIPITLTKQGIPLVHSSYPQQKLWKKSLHAFGMNAKQLKAIITREDKFFVPVKNQFFTKMLPPGGVFELIKTEGAHISITPIKSLQQLHTLYKHTYRNFFMKDLGILAWHFNTITKLVNAVDLYQVERPTDRFTAYELAHRLSHKCYKEERVK